MSIAAVGASMFHDGFATPPSHSRCATPPRDRVIRTAGQMLLDDSETLVVHLLSGGSFALNSAALREAGATCTVEIRRFVAFKLGVMPYQVHLLDGFRLLSDDDSIFQSPLTVAVASSDSDLRMDVHPSGL